jgi:hypothetical protein
MPKGIYYFANKAGARFGAGMMQEHHITVEVLDGGRWSGKIDVAPNHVVQYAVRKGVTKIKVKSDVVGWPKAEFKLPAALPTYSPKVIVTEHKNKVGFDFAYVEDIGPVHG